MTMHPHHYFPLLQNKLPVPFHLSVAFLSPQAVNDAKTAIVKTIAKHFFFILSPSLSHKQYFFLLYQFQTNLPSFVRHDLCSRLQEMKEYLELCLQGESTIVPRKEMLAKKQEELRTSIKELEESVAYIDWKQNFYDEVLSGERPYVSNLIRTQ